MRRFIYLMAGIILCFSSCDKPFDGAYRVNLEDPISKTLEADPDFSLWVAVLKKTDLFNTLNYTPTVFTHFAVKNEPLKQYAKETWDADDIRDVDVNELKEFIRYHTIPNYQISARNMSGKISRRTATKAFLTANYDPVTDVRTILNGAKEPSVIIEQDWETINGYIQVLDKPLVTEFRNIWDVLSSHESVKNGETVKTFSIFCEAIEKAGLREFLERIDTTFYFDDGDVVKQAQLERTIFAVTDEAYENYQIESYEDLKHYIDTEVGMSDSPDNKEQFFWQYVAYHILPKRMSYSDLALFPLDPVKKDGTRLKRMTIYPYNEIKGLMKGISIEDQLGGLVFNPHVSSISQDFRIESDLRDIPASNGYIHGIDNIMLKPDEMAFFPVEIELTDEVQFRGISFYRDYIAEGTSPRTETLHNGDIPTISWTVNSSSVEVYYINTWMEDDFYLNQDAIYFNMGAVGYIDFQLPPLPMTGNDHRLRIYAVKLRDPIYGGNYAVTVNREWLGNRGFKNADAWEGWSDIRMGTEGTSFIRLSVGTLQGLGGIDRLTFMPFDNGGNPIYDTYYSWEEVPTV